ncbi:ParB/RepB/Spo0J family partition protein [Streptomyces sp. NPDC089799]|uniref:ParB/RepB/Spo0J family partition protein n=1 Tax=Streptomyces sp. NPDC089799 TaxID=3155066 RepID=UPI0034169E1C
MSSKTSEPGTGAAFARVQTAGASHQAINTAANPAASGALPPLKLPVDVISLNPANPRSSLSGLGSLAASLRDHGQKQAITVMSRSSYLQAHPDQAQELEDGTEYVAIEGNSRLAAAREAGLDEIKVMIDEELGSTPDEILQSALVANIHRQDLDPLDEARALQQLLQATGTQDALAARLHRSQGWVSQRLALLRLTPELQEKLLSGQEPAELLRRVGNKKPEEQVAHLEQLKRQKAAKRRVPPTAPAATAPGATKASTTAAAGPPPDHYGVMTAPDTPTSQKATPGLHTPPDASRPATLTQNTLLWDDIDAVIQQIRTHMTPQRVVQLTIKLAEGNRQNWT